MSQFAYDNLAEIYDFFQREIDAGEWANYIKVLYERHQLPHEVQGERQKPLLLDLGCGTGRVLSALADLGFDPIGVDQSSAMLMAARERFASSGKAAILLQQDITTFELYGTVDCCTSLLDTVNHLPNEQAVRACFALVANYLHPGGVFIFDLGTEKHFADTLGNGEFFDVTESYALLWQNTYEEQLAKSRSELTLFTKTRGEQYVRNDLTIEEQYYSPVKVRQWLEEAGFADVKLYAELDFTEPGADEERVFIVCHKPIHESLG